jgi:hypothetical protein
MQAIVAVLPLGGASSCLAVLIEDGSVQLLDRDSLKAQPLPLRCGGRSRLRLIATGASGYCCW